MLISGIECGQSNIVASEARGLVVKYLMLECIYMKSLDKKQSESLRQTTIWFPSGQH